MTLVEFVSILKQTGYPVAYSHFDNEPPSIPFIAYLTATTENFHADDQTYLKVTNPDIELYTRKKDLQAEQTLEQVLDDNNIPYDVVETYIDTEKLFQRIYETGVIIDG